MGEGPPWLILQEDAEAAEETDKSPILAGAASPGRFPGRIHSPRITRIGADSDPTPGVPSSFERQAGQSWARIGGWLSNFEHIEQALIPTSIFSSFDYLVILPTPNANGSHRSQSTRLFRTRLPEPARNPRQNPLASGHPICEGKRSDCWNVNVLVSGSLLLVA